ncbi:3935_t:CDS:2 [Acaulospora colombiana]|uniref:3935_t:CDS:1 n=1 Tax=Acaulospora colombiana TaxID=27376 RepID=A0ACA9KTK2_9GLOM|nr:3935_t:CDS:2 [Acaulospora colombiana]
MSENCRALDHEAAKDEDYVEGDYWSEPVGVDTPVLYFVDLEESIIYMEFVEGKVIKDLILEVNGEWSCEENKVQLAEKIGVAIARMHAVDVIHGDLTTSNLLLRNSNKSLVVIDFGLSYVSSLPEDKAVDLYVLERAFLSTHPNSEDMFTAILKAYEVNYKAAKGVLTKLADGAVREVWSDKFGVTRPHM